ncbi:MAG: hypothetical protein CL676_01110 [Bdellovibrionaceae bacterium]|nr:hypothetical protein [Pseudobdellovibrionaceae bacterium]|tara:strand:+ start:3792 stop:4136 length:345 start_codon:yes stop_codon:yes gene_type:complete
MKFWILAMLIPSAFALTDSVWEQNKKDSYQMRAVIKGMSNENGGAITVMSLSKDEGTQKETFSLCSKFPGGDSFDSHETLRQGLIQQSFFEGRPVTLFFDGPFHSCIKDVSLEI